MNPNQASDGAYYDQLAYEEAQRQRNDRLVRAAAPCVAWEDGYHCWTEDRDLPTSKPAHHRCGPERHGMRSQDARSGAYLT